MNKNIINEAVNYESPEDLIELIESELKIIRAKMKDDKIRKSVFDTYSHMAWGIETFLFNLYDCSPHMDIAAIRNLIFIHIEEYEKYIENASDKHDTSLYDGALEAMKSIEVISRAFK